MISAVEAGMMGHILHIGTRKKEENHLTQKEHRYVRSIIVGFIMESVLFNIELGVISTKYSIVLLERTIPYEV